MTLAVGQQWTCRAPEATHARLVIGAILAFEGAERIVCVSVAGAVQADHERGAAAVAVPFVPMGESAFADSVAALEGSGDVGDEFLEQFDRWYHGEKGLTYFTVPFEGSLDRMIATQMAVIVQSRQTQ
jgi:hypothetical protein